MFALAVWLPTTSSALQRAFAPLVRPYMTLFGFLQNWSMFAPDPSPVDIYVEARLTYADGHTKSWDYPRMARLGIFQKYQQERFRKMIEQASTDGFNAAWPDLARYAARQNDPDPRDPPVSVELIRHYRFIPPPGQPLTPYQSASFYQTAITTEDLR